MPLSDKLKNSKFKPSGKRTEPLWKGPASDGVTFSLISRFLCCRERFRLLVVEGLKAADSFSHRRDFGSMWHVCEEALAKKRTGCPNCGQIKCACRPSEKAMAAGLMNWQFKLEEYCRSLCRQYPTQQNEIDKWFNVCRVQFPIYVDYWAKHQDVVERTTLLQEYPFNVPYTLPSGRVVRLRGKFDSVDLIGKGKAKGIYLQENKTKGDIREDQIKRQLTFDLQVMIYLVALVEGCKTRGRDGDYPFNEPILGVRYNVIRRPLSGGKGTIVQHKPTKNNPQGESKTDYYARLAQYIKDAPQEYFFRWQCQINQADITKFKHECLDPILEQLCDWWQWVTAGLSEYGTLPSVWRANNVNHWRHPFGVYNPLDEGGSTDVDGYLESGSEVGLERTDNLYPELTEVKP